MKRAPLFFRTVYDEEALDDCFYDLIHTRMSEQDKIEVGCLIQYLMILKSNGRIRLPLDITKHRQGEGPDFTLCSAEGLFGVEMTKVTTADYQVWLKRRLNYRPVRDIAAYQNHRPEQRVGDLARLRVMRKNFKISNYFACVPDMAACDLVLEEDGDCSMDIDVLMQRLTRIVGQLKYQRFRRISMLSGSVLYYAINTDEAEVLYAPEIRPVWLKPHHGVVHASLSAAWH